MGPEATRGLAATKVRPPMPPARLVQRPQLIEALDDAVEGPVRFVLVSAPAGSGKSTLLASWLAERPGAAAWLQVEESDSDPVRFWSYLVEAMAKVHPGLGERLQPVVAGSGGAELVVVSALVNELTDRTDPLIIVIDDHHLITGAGVQRGIERLIDLCPSQVTLVISTRFDPPFRLGRLRVRGQVREIRAADLRFGAGDAAALLGPTGRTLSPFQLDALCGRTEGWAAGLVLAGLSMERAPDVDEFIAAFRGDDQLVVEYLRDELLTGLDPQQQRHLLETSVLDQLSGELVDAVTGTAGGSRWLQETSEANQLLVALDRTGTWFRYHHLLRDLLRLEAVREIPERLPLLHARAATWFESQGQFGPAIDHRLAAEDPAAAARLMRVHGPRLLAAGQVDTLRTLLLRLGPVARQVTWCALLMGWCELIAGRASLAAEWLDDMVEAAPPDFDHAVAIPLRINISLAGGDVAGALVAARPMDDLEVLRSRSPELATAVGASYAWAGRTDDARRVLRLAVSRAEAEGLRSAWILALVYLAVVEVDAGSPGSAHEAARLAVDTASGFGLADYNGVGPAYAIRGRTTPEDPDQARHDAQHAVTLARRGSSDLALACVLSVAADTLLGLGEVDAGRALLIEARTLVDQSPDPGIVGRLLDRAESRHHQAPPPEHRPALVEQLTDRELAVLRHLPGPLTQRDIATELFVSMNTVKTHCQAIYRKLGAADRRAAVQAARDHGLL